MGALFISHLFRFWLLKRISFSCDEKRVVKICLLHGFMVSALSSSSVTKPTNCHDQPAGTPPGKHGLLLNCIAKLTICETDQDRTDRDFMGRLYSDRT